MVSLGCPKNRVDSEIILGLLSDNGYSITNEPGLADIIIINTCSFIRPATEESIETILDYARFKSSGRCELLIVAGCLTQRYLNDLKKELPEVDLFVGTGEYQHMARLIAESGKKGRVLEAGKPEYIDNFTTHRISTTPFYTSYIKIAEGCSNACTFCIIPALRGDYRSRSESSILEEVNSLASKGVKEFNLVAQDTTAYGRDFTEPSSLEGLIVKMAAVEKVQWIRLLYCYPTLLTDGLIKLIASEEKILSYIDLPLQHIDDSILKAMKRGTREITVKRLVYKIREAIPGATLRTSFIVGFPGEGEKEFENLLDFVREVRFDHIGVFKYSPEEGTPAASLPGQVSEEIKEQRYCRLMEVQQGISFEKNRARVGQRVKVLVEGSSEETDLLLQGRAVFQAPEIDGVTYINSGSASAGEIKEVLITEAHPYDLVGEIVERQG